MILELLDGTKAANMVAQKTVENQASQNGKVRTPTMSQGPPGQHTSRARISEKNKDRNNNH